MANKKTVNIYKCSKSRDNVSSEVLAIEIEMRNIEKIIQQRITHIGSHVGLVR